MGRQKTKRSDHLKRHMMRRDHMIDNNEGTRMGVNMANTCNMGRHMTKTCNACFKTMKSDNLKRHMMRRDHMLYNNEGKEAVNVASDSGEQFITHEIEMYPISSWSDNVESDGEMPSKRYESMIETKKQCGAGRVEPEKEKNPQPEIEN